MKLFSDCNHNSTVTKEDISFHNRQTHQYKIMLRRPDCSTDSVTLCNITKSVPRQPSKSIVKRWITPLHLFTCSSSVTLFFRGLLQQPYHFLSLPESRYSEKVWCVYLLLSQSRVKGSSGVPQAADSSFFSLPVNRNSLRENYKVHSEVNLELNENNVFFSFLISEDKIQLAHFANCLHNDKTSPRHTAFFPTCHHFTFAD